jgi:hypothetical protein
MVLRGCEGPRPGAKVASDPAAPSHLFGQLDFRPRLPRGFGLVSVI